MLIVLGLAVGPDYLFTKLQQKDPYFGRREYMESSLRMIPDKPLMGVGMGNWPAAYPAYAIFDKGYFANQAHNDWAQWAVEGGLPFFLLMLSVAVWSFPHGLSLRMGNRSDRRFFSVLCGLSDPAHGCCDRVLLPSGGNCIPGSTPNAIAHFSLNPTGSARNNSGKSADFLEALTHIY